jgi:hypothetical protein
MSKDKYQTEYLLETGDDWVNSQGEPDIDYVAWLESKLSKTLPDLEAAEKEIERLRGKLNEIDGLAVLYKYEDWDEVEAALEKIKAKASQ